MNTRIVRIGNSHGIRSPKSLLEQTGGEVEITVEAGTLVIRRIRQPREGWDEAFREMATQGDDALLDADAPSMTRWDEEEWQW